VTSLADIRYAFAAHRPSTTDDARNGRAAVALVLRDVAGEPELLFIERARRAGDPWSGHMAFPGGRMERGDSSARHAAERETLEEVGIALARGKLLGRLDDLGERHAGRSIGLVISAFVYEIAEPGADLALSDEVRTALWVPLAHLVDPALRTEYELRRGGSVVRYPGIRVGGSDPRVVWGLTYRFLETFLAVTGRPLPDRWQDFAAAPPPADEPVR
jgi:8-oxo-dGTP pyrophosphatase MutT (NUDIX family)